MRASGLAHGQGFVDRERMDHGSPLRSGAGIGGPMELEGWSGMRTEVIFHLLHTFHVLGLFGQVENIPYFNTQGRGRG